MEEYSIETSDGYLLNLSRIAKGIQNGPAVLLLHGYNSDMMQWVYHKPESAPAFILTN